MVTFLSDNVLAPQSSDSVFAAILDLYRRRQLRFCSEQSPPEVQRQIRNLPSMMLTYAACIDAARILAPHLGLPPTAVYELATKLFNELQHHSEKS
ncbi:MAG: hypothetical protein Q6K99_06585 [Thermostichales cyanobacterium BF4_bins_65]